MASYEIQGCTVDDAAGLARSNMTAFWTDPTWVLLWENKTPDYVVEQCAKRFPRNLLTDRVRKRHQKVVDAETGEIVGYCRWILPDRLSGEWLEAQTPAVDPAKEKEFDKLFASADWTMKNMDGLDDHVPAIMEKYKGRQDYIELEYLAVRPAARNRGIATMLVQSGIAQSEKLGVDILVLAFKAGLGLYTRLGFVMLEYHIQDDSKFGGKGEYGTYFMERKIGGNSNDLAARAPEGEKPAP